MSTALILDLDRVAATRLSFFLGIPALTGAGLYELKDAVGAGVGAVPLAVGTAVSFVVAYASIAWLLKFVAKHSFNAFVIYRMVVGVLLLGLLGAERSTRTLGTCALDTERSATPHRRVGPHRRRRWPRSRSLLRLFPSPLFRRVGDVPRHALTTLEADHAVPDSDSPTRITVISASMGAGHDGAATELTRHLTAAGFLVDRHDFLDLLPARIGAALRRLPPAADLGPRGLPAHLRRHRARTTPQPRRTGPAARRRTPHPRHRHPRHPRGRLDLPRASQVLGALRLRGRLAIPALTYLTDFSVHSLWVAPGIDAPPRAAHAIPAAQAHEQGAAGVTADRPDDRPALHPRRRGRTACRPHPFRPSPGRTARPAGRGLVGVGAVGRPPRRSSAAGSPCRSWSADSITRWPNGCARTASPTCTAG